jgi:sugar lactone lactonase YvrE
LKSLVRGPALFVITSIVICAAEASWIEQYVQEATAANKACTAKEFAACRGHLESVYKLVDGRADIVFRLASVEASLGNQQAALDWLSVYSKSGLTFADPSAESEFAALKDAPEFQAILARLKAARQPVSNSKPFLTLPEKDLIAEDIAYDPARDRFFVSSVRHRKILSVTKRGKVTEFLPEGQPNIWAILALCVDSKRKVLWASTAAMPEAIGFTKQEEGRSALLKYSLESGALLKRYDLKTDAKHALGDMTVSSEGDVYASDGFGPVYWVEHTRDTIEPLFETGTFRSPQTPALSPDEKRLFVPDYSRGISIVDLATKQWKLLEHPKELSLGGIDGLYLKGRTMLAIQNGTKPARVIRMSLDDSLTRVTKWETIEANWPGLGDPTHGVVVGNQFYFITNSGWDRMNDDGSVKQGATFEAPQIRVIKIK